MEPCRKTLDAGMYQLTVGMAAWRYRYYAKVQTPEQRGQYEFAEFEAKAKKAGLWQDLVSVAPWEWRRAKRSPVRGDGQPDQPSREGARVMQDWLQFAWNWVQALWDDDKPDRGSDQPRG